MPPSPFAVHLVTGGESSPELVLFLHSLSSARVVALDVEWKPRRCGPADPGDDPLTGAGASSLPAGSASATAASFPGFPDLQHGPAPPAMPPRPRFPARPVPSRVHAAPSTPRPLGSNCGFCGMDLVEGLVADSTASSLQSWIGFAIDHHKALHSSSPGSNRKDAPTRLLEWVDAGVVHQRNGAVGLLRYSAIVASGGHAHLSSGIVLVSDSMDVEIVVADSNNTLDGQVIDNLLEVTAMASFLFEEGAITVICIVLMNFKSITVQMTGGAIYSMSYLHFSAMWK